MKLKITPPRFEDDNRWEDAYRRQEFAPLVELALDFSIWIRKRLSKKPRGLSGTNVGAVSGLDRGIRSSRSDARLRKTIPGRS